MVEAKKWAHRVAWHLLKCTGPKPDTKQRQKAWDELLAELAHQGFAMKAGESTPLHAHIDLPPSKESMSSKAYLVGLMDCTEHPSRLLRVDTFSEPCPTVMGAEGLLYATWVIVEAEGEDYTSACRALDGRYLAWVRRMNEESARADRLALILFAKEIAEAAKFQTWEQGLDRWRRILGGYKKVVN